VWLAVNGEIFNYKALRDSLPGTSFLTDSDCEPILHLYEAGGDDVDVSALLNSLIGMFAFVLTDERTDRFIAARDHMGIIPLYMYEATTNEQPAHVALVLLRLRAHTAASRKFSLQETYPTFADPFLLSHACSNCSGVATLTEPFGSLRR
jgi:asparagine synthetase B (glutamine-hydrolysing)